MAEVVRVINHSEFSQHHLLTKHEESLCYNNVYLYLHTAFYSHTVLKICSIQYTAQYSASIPSIMAFSVDNTV